MKHNVFIFRKYMVKKILIYKYVYIFYLTLLSFITLKDLKTVM